MSEAADDESTDLIDPSEGWTPRQLTRLGTLSLASAAASLAIAVVLPLLVGEVAAVDLVALVALMGTGVLTIVGVSLLTAAAVLKITRRDEAGQGG